MKRIFTIFFALFVAGSVWAATFEVDGIRYFTNNDGVSMDEAGVCSRTDGYSGSVTIPSYVRYENKDYRVVTIKFAFKSCTGLTSITIPNSVTSIGESAFSGCTGLTSITIPNSVTSIGKSAFSDCTGLTSVTIPNSVTSIGESAFSGCTNLTSVTIPNSVTSIGKSAFSSCTSLTSVTIPNSVTSIGESAFSGCTGLTSVTISNNVTSIGKSAFSGCTTLTSITIPNSVTSIGKSAFFGCTGLTSATISNSVTSLDATFTNCTRLTNVTIPNSVTSIGESAFSGCISLTSIIIPNSVTSIGESAFFGCKNLNSIAIPESVTSIGESAFSGCKSLTSITIPSSVTSIDRWAFYNNGLKSITIACDMMNWDTDVFDGFQNDVTITILSSVHSIKEHTWPYFNYSWDRINIDFYFEGMEPPIIYHDVYDEYDLKWETKECEECDLWSLAKLNKVFVPCEAIETYKEKWPNIAIFAQQPHVGNNEHCTITVTPDCPNYIMKAVPQKGYKFVSWSDGNTDIERVVAVDSTVYEAIVVPCTVTATTESSEQGSVDVSYNEKKNNYVLTAIPNDGYRFVEWTDGNTANPRTVSPQTDESYVAVFEANKTAIPEVSNATAVTIVNGQILVNGEAPAFVVTVSGQKIPNANLKSGVYFVVVDGKTVGVSVR